MEHAVKLTVDGESQLITLNEMVHPIHCMFHVLFEDGYDNIFFTDVEFSKWVEQDLGFTARAQQIGKKVAKLYSFNWINKPVNWYCKTDELGRTLHFGYSRDTSGGYVVYEIFAPNRRYLFTLVRLKSHVWQLFKIPGSGWEYNEEYMQKVPFVLEDLGL
jgi:hypothetical protein